MFKIEIPKISKENLEYLINDFNLLKEMFNDDIILYNRNSNDNNEREIQEQNNLNFLIKLKNEIEVPESTIEVVKSLNLDELLSPNNTIEIPFWLKIFYDEKNEVLVVNFYIYWIKEKQYIIGNIRKRFEKIEEPYLFNTIDYTKEILNDSLEKEEILDLLSEIKFNNTTSYTNPINILMELTGANEGLEEFEYESNKKNKINEETKPKTKNPETKVEIKSEIKEKVDINEKNYNLFFKNGGKVGETLTDRTNSFQAHGIKINSEKDFLKYKGWLLNQHKIKNATHNILAYRFYDKEKKTIIEDFDDGGQHGAGIRVLGIMQKMNINNIFICVSRWDGGKHIGHDKYKRIDDRTSNLIYSNLDYFKGK